MKVTVNANKTIAYLKKYRDGLEAKKIKFIEELAKIGINVAYFSIANGIGDTPKDATFGIRFESTGEPTIGFVTAKSESNPENLLFWEFGAGNYHNSKENPKAADFGMGVGTYPGQTHVPDPGFWWYKKEGDKKAHYSVGTKAAMPMFNASVVMAKKVEEVAREVFGNV